MNEAVTTLACSPIKNAAPYKSNFGEEQIKTDSAPNEFNKNKEGMSNGPVGVQEPSDVEEVTETEHQYYDLDNWSRWEKFLSGNVVLQDIRKDLWCPICDRWFLTSNDLEHHLGTHNDSSIKWVPNASKKSFQCDACCKTYISQSSLRCHVCNKNKSTYFECDYCKKRFPRKFALGASEHVRSAHSDIDKPFICEICQKGYSNRRDLLRHMTIHAQKTYPCSVCKKSLSSKGNLRAHQLIHTDDFKFSCDQCDRKFKWKNNYNAHLLMHAERKNPGTRPRPHQCHLCEKTYLRRAELKNHELAVHIGEKSLTCDICHTGFTDRNKLVSHIKTHSEVRPFACNYCDKRFRTKYYMEEHTNRMHTMKNVFECDACHKQYGSKFSLIDHIARNHTKMKPHACQLCPARFIGASCLKRHQVVHTKSKKYFCDQCNKSFSLQQSLTLHKKIHTDIRNFSCDICLKRFITSANLMSHLIIHSGTKPFECGVCPRKFSTQSSRKRHERLRHGENLTTQRRKQMIATKTSNLEQIKTDPTLYEDHEIKHEIVIGPTRIQELPAMAVTELENGQNKQKNTLKTETPFNYNDDNIQTLWCAICDRWFLTFDDLARHLNTHENTSAEQKPVPNVPEQSFRCKVCYVSYKSKITLSLHKCKPVNRPFRCDYCDKYFTRKWCLQEHMAIHSREKPYSCHECGKCFAKTSSLNQHIRDQHQQRIYICDLCGKNFNNKSNLVTHMNTHITIRAHSCKICEKRFKTKVDLRSHMITHSPEEHLCHLCMKTLRSRDSLRAHLMTHNDVFKYTCDQCGKKFKWNNNYKAHLLMHAERKNPGTRPRPYQCNLCEKRYIRRSDLKKHELSVHIGEKSSTCDICNKGFTDKYALSTHLKTHSELRSFACNYCDKRLKTQGSLQEHTKRMHTMKKMFECNWCHKRLKTQGSLQEHTNRMHTMKKMFECNWCHKRWPTKTELRSHISYNHTQNKPHRCKLCPARFVDGQGLKRHQLVHTKLKKFFCDQCDKKFSLNSSLKLHKKIHSDTKDFACDICDKRFVQRIGLMTHLIIHSKIQPFECSVCQRKFSNSSSRTRHERLIHHIRLLRRGGTVTMVRPKKKK